MYIIEFNWLDFKSQIVSIISFESSAGINNMMNNTDYNLSVREKY